jgi:hypothetical protein
MPEEIRLLWSSFSRDDESVPATVTDPESSRSVRLSADDPELV